MKRILIAIYITMMGYGAQAQFTTLTYSTPIEKDTLSSEEEKPAAETTKKTKEKKARRVTKKGLKKRIDSLEALLSGAPSEFDIYKAVREELVRKSALAITQQRPKEDRLTSVEPHLEPLSFALPLDGELRITSAYGNRYHPTLHKNKKHYGVDLRANYAPVFSVLDGTVEKVAYDPNGGGNYVKIKHKNGYETLYMHLSKPTCKVGENITAGEAIAISGNSGNTTGPHLHFAVKYRGNYIDPTQFLNELITTYNQITKHHGKFAIAD